MLLSHHCVQVGADHVWSYMLRVSQPKFHKTSKLNLKATKKFKTAATGSELAVFWNKEFIGHKL